MHCCTVVGFIISYYPFFVSHHCIRFMIVTGVLSCYMVLYYFLFFFFFQAEDGIRDLIVTGVQTCALPIYSIKVSQSSLLRTARRFPFRVTNCTDCNASNPLMVASVMGQTRTHCSLAEIGRASCRERV